MDPFPFTDAAGRTWHVFDYIVVGVGQIAKKRAVPIGDYRSEARAFVPVNREGPVLVYSFGAVAYRDDLRPKFLEDELRFAKPLGATAADRMQGDNASAEKHA